MLPRPNSLFRPISLLTTALVGVIAGILLSHRPPVQLHAMTAHGTDNKTLITVPLEGGMEAVVELDHITCNMTGYVLDRFSGQFFLQYRHNVAADFNLRQGKLPRFLMAAGQANFRRFSGNERIADGVIYVSEEQSGQIVAYAIPWNTQFRASTSGPQVRSFIPLDAAATRFPTDIPIR